MEDEHYDNQSNDSTYAQNELIEERDYYAILQVDRKASLDEIRKSYLNLSREFHPDRRRREPSLIPIATIQYPALDEAYKVLTDKTTRHVYDTYGEKGLMIYYRAKQENRMNIRPIDQFGITNQYQSTEELHHHVENLLRKWHHDAILEQFPSQSHFELQMNATKFIAQPMKAMKTLLNFSAWQGDVPWNYWKRISTNMSQQLVFKNFGHNPNCVFTLGGFLNERAGSSGAVTGINTSFTYTSPTPDRPSVSVSSVVTNESSPGLHADITQPISQTTAIVFRPEYSLDEGIDTVVGFNHVIAHNLQSMMSYSPKNGLVGSLHHVSGRTQSQGLIQVIPSSGPAIQFICRQSFDKKTSSISWSGAKVSCRASIWGGLVFSIGAHKNLSKHSQYAFAVQIERAGVTLRLRWNYGGVRISVPILLCPVWSMQTTVSTLLITTIPSIVHATLQQLLYPAREARRKLQLAEKAQGLVLYRAAAKENAMHQQKLMQKRALDNLEKEAKTNGLRILLAKYGTWTLNKHEKDSAIKDPDEKTEHALEPDHLKEETWVDVTVPCQFFVHDSILSFPAMPSRKQILGFYDPTISADETVSSAHENTRWFGPWQWLKRKNAPELYIRYAFKSHVCEVTFKDTEAVELPSKFAIVMGEVGRVQ